MGCYPLHLPSISVIFLAFFYPSPWHPTPLAYDYSDYAAKEVRTVFC